MAPVLCESPEDQRSWGGDMEGARHREPLSRLRGGRYHGPHQGQVCCFYKEAPGALVVGGAERGATVGQLLHIDSFLSLGAFGQALQDLLAMELKQDFHLQ